MSTAHTPSLTGRLARRARCASHDPPPRNHVGFDIAFRRAPTRLAGVQPESSLGRRSEATSHGPARGLVMCGGDSSPPLAGKTPRRTQSIVATLARVPACERRRPCRSLAPMRSVPVVVSMDSRIPALPPSALVTTPVVWPPPRTSAVGRIIVMVVLCMVVCVEHVRNPLFLSCPVF